MKEQAPTFDEVDLLRREILALRQEAAQREEVITTVRAALAQSEARFQALDQRASRVAEMLASLRRAHQSLLGSLVREKERAEALAARARKLEIRWERAATRLHSARTSLSFRIGRASKVAFGKRGDLLGIPGRWLETFRGEDDVLAELPIPTTSRNQPDERMTDAPVAAAERDILLAGLGRSSRPLRGIAGVVGPELARELGRVARYVALEPHTWRHVLALESPAFVLITTDGTAATAWAGWGTPGGRDAASCLAELTASCREQHIPVVYWDTAGAPRGIPLGVHFDALFTVSPRCCVQASTSEAVPELLLPAVEPLALNPIEVPCDHPAHPAYLGAFDRRADRADLAAREAVLRAAAPHGLLIYDVNFGSQGPSAGVVRFPEDLVPRTRRVPSGDGAMRAIQAAGVVICGSPVAGADFPSFDLLRGLALGVHVLSTQAAIGDPVLAEALAVAGEHTAAAAVERQMGRRRLDGLWHAAFRRVLSAYSLADRVEQMARACGADPVTRPRPSLALVAELRTSEELESLGAFLAAQGTPPEEVRVLCSDGLEAKPLLARAIAPSRLVVVPAGEGSALGEVAASHLLLWRRGTPVTGEEIAELTDAAALHDGPVIALATPADDRIVYRRGPLGSDSTVALRREDAAAYFRAGLGPEQVIAALLAAAQTGLLKTRSVG